MKSLIKSSKLTLLFGFLLLVFFVVFSFISITSINIQPAPIYNNINNLKVGTSTSKDVAKSLGDPISAKVKNNKIIGLYETEYDVVQNIVALKDDKVEYYVEIVYGDDPNAHNEQINKHGTPDLKLYEHAGETIEWNLYLSEGHGFASSPFGYLSKTMRFVPVDKSVFLNTIAKDLDLTSNVIPQNEDLAPLPEEPTLEPE